MSGYYLVVRQGDTAPRINTVLYDGSATVNLTGATVVFRARRLDGTTAVITKQADVVNATGGAIEVELSAQDTAVAGEYAATFQVTKSGSTVTFPTTGYVRFVVTRSL